MMWHSESMTLPVSDGKGRIHGVAPLATLAFMAWPKSPRDAFLVTDTWQRDLTLTMDGTVADTTRAKLKLIVSRWPGGQLAGQVLLHLLTLAAHYPEHASINKAQYLVHRAFMRDSNDGSTGLRTLKAHWSNYQPCVHLWATAAKYPGLMSDDIGEFLRVAEIISGTARLYDITLTEPLWSLPADVDRYTQYLFEIPKLTDDGESALSEYRAPSTTH